LILIYRYEKADKEPKNTRLKEQTKNEKELLIEQNELLKKQIEILQQKQQSEAQENAAN
jgi:hypothetical protein